MISRAKGGTSHTSSCLDTTKIGLNLTLNMVIWVASPPLPLATLTPKERSVPPPLTPERGQGYISLQGYFWLISGLLWAITLKFGTKTPFGKLWKDFGSDLWNLVSNPTYCTPQKEPKMPKIAKISFLSYSLQIHTRSAFLCLMIRSHLIFNKINSLWCKEALESSQK